MTRATIPAPSAARPMPRAVSALRGFAATLFGTERPLPNSGPALTAATSQKPAGATPTETGGPPMWLLLTQREILIAEARHARNLRQCELASLIEADLRAVTLECLRGGNAKAR